MSVAPALKLSDRPTGRIRPELDGLRSVLADCGDPQLDYPSILIVGTNGKGSTAAMLEAVFRAHGFATGLFTSPHLVRVEERVQLNGVPVDSTVLETHIGLFDASPDLTYFETLAAAAFSIFSKARIDVAVLEAGMGGSWDATRLAESAIAGLTNVGSDHAGWLGDEPSAIARDKGRALAAAERAVLGSGVDESLLVDLGAPAACRAGSLVDCSVRRDGRVRLRWDGHETVVDLPLEGDFQLKNLELALALAVEAVTAGLMTSLIPSRVQMALEAVKWPGRLSSHPVDGREVLMDCAHNLEAAQSLAHFLGGLEHRYNLLFSCLADKPVEAMAKVLRPLVGDVVVCRLDDERAMPVERLAAAFTGAGVANDPRSGLDRLEDPVLAAGSVRLVGELIALAQGEL
jgi:dihydrofolate synthase/folylpolyglutamate synthase